MSRSFAPKYHLTITLSRINLAPCCYLLSKISSVQFGGLAADYDFGLPWCVRSPNSLEWLQVRGSELWYLACRSNIHYLKRPFRHQRQHRPQISIGPVVQRCRTNQTISVASVYRFSRTWKASCCFAILASLL